MEKLIFLDIDGTLVDYHNQLPDSAAEAVREARGRGTRVYLCTGRLLDELNDEIVAVGFDGLIGGNGTYIKDGSEVLLDRSFSAQQEREIVDWLQSEGLAFYLETNDGLFASPDFETEALAAVRAYHGDPDITVRKAFPSLRFGENLYRDDVKKISYALKDAGVRERAKAAFPGLKHGMWGGDGDRPLFGDIGVEGIDKGTAVRMITGRHGGPEAKTFAFGDATPDIPMFAVCDVSVAMGGGGPEVKEAATITAPRVEEDGLAHAFRELGLTGPGKG